MRRNEHVILFRNPVPVDIEQHANGRTADPYESAITARGLVAHTFPVLEQEFVNVSQLEDMLRRPRDWAAVVATSKRAGEAWVHAARCRRAEREEEHDWSQTPLYTPGAATTSAFSAPDLSHCWFPTIVSGSEETGCAERLGPFIVSDTRHQQQQQQQQTESQACNAGSSSSTTTTRPFLILVGDKNSSELTDHLQRHQLAYKELQVYRTGPRTDIQRRLTDLLGDIAASHSSAEGAAQPVLTVWFAWFSPSSAQAVLYAAPAPAPAAPASSTQTATAAAAAGTRPHSWIQDLAVDLAARYHVQMRIRMAAIGKTTTSYLVRQMGEITRVVQAEAPNAALQQAGPKMGLYVVDDSKVQPEFVNHGDSLLDPYTDRSVETAPVLKWRLTPKRRHNTDGSGKRTSSAPLGSVPSLTDCCLRKIDANLENYTLDDFRAQINPVQANWVIKWVTRARNNTLSTPTWWIAARICGKENVVSDEASSSSSSSDSAHFVSLRPAEILHHLSTHLALRDMQIPRTADFSIITTLSLSSLGRTDNSRISELRHLPHLTFLILNDSQLSDYTLSNLAMGLELKGSPAEWKGMWRLRGIWLDGSKGISDKSIKSLWKFPLLNVISLCRTSVTDAGHAVLQAISKKTNHKYAKANSRFHTELALGERPAQSVRTGTVQDRIYKGYHRLWPHAVGWEGSPEYPSYRVHVTGDPNVVDPVTRTRAHGRESAPIDVDSLPHVNRYPMYNFNAPPGSNTTGPSRSSQRSNEDSKRFVSAGGGARPQRRKKRAVADDKAPQGVARQTVLFGMLVREAIDEREVSADTVRMNLEAVVEYDRKVMADKKAAAAPHVPVKVGLFAAPRPAPNQQVDISQYHIPITKSAGTRDKRYGDRAKYQATKALTRALTACPLLISSQLSASTTSSASSSTSWRSSATVSQDSSVFSTPRAIPTPSIPVTSGRSTAPLKPLGRLASASLSSDPAEAPVPAKRVTGYGMFRKK
ncbi:hypothetical protein QFC21_001512 [Naganishia friedmannii]|uniref:Uncharacterized protein n=1 Tax=Naganishia friedmannii TaxID=89922 RepID=A0ACC2W5M1_9TREE|nr:hypothetical protein QFC21_001512 [Naganishia friedmannii]